jgi:hypothetical protein
MPYFRKLHCARPSTVSYVDRAKCAAEHGPVFITDRGKPAYVLLRHEEWLRLYRPSRSPLDVMAMPEGDRIDFGPPHLGDGLYRAEDLDAGLR